MSLFNNQNKSRKLESGNSEIKAGKTMSRSSIINNSIPNSDSKPKAKENKRATTTFSVTVKVSNHTRNKIMALKGIGKTDTIKDFIDSSVNKAISNLSNNELSKFNGYKTALEHRDYYASKLHK